MSEAVGKFEAPSMSRRMMMSTMLGGSLGVVALGALYPVVSYFIPPSSGSGAKGLIAQDALGKPISVSELLASHGSTDRVLAQGLKGDPTYIVINEGAVANYGLNAVCTHLGCVVPWNAGENLFKCPCHGSQYAANGKVVRGPAPKSLELVTASLEEDNVRFTVWEGSDFRNA
ncbi:MAG: cytochrome b6-f complex iron-sulfur subunit [Cyanobacteriota bacterium]|nr:cytochrome b6-f complex iron-sulfur subunit [Cyanobacteriota bacterium]